MRRAQVWTYDPEQSVELPKKTVKPGQVPTEPVRTQREQYGEDQLRNGQAEFIDNPGSIF